ncbi:MAG: MFS transporter [Actinomycetota bacterium]|nr:MFS transporter [Actinomycetota bacterium]
MIRRSLPTGPLTEREFRLLFTGQALSVIGDGIAPIALAFAVLDLTHSPTDLGLVLTAGYLPMVAFLLIGGVWADRLSRRAVMLAADAIRAATQATIGILLLTGSARLWELVVLQVIYGIAAAFFRPAATGLIPATVSPPRLQSANAMLGTSESLGFTIGPAVGGVLVAGLGTGVAFVFDAATFLWSIVCLARMHPRAVEPPAPQRFMSDLADGFREVRTRKWVWVSILAVGLSLMVEVAPLQVLGPVIARVHFGGATAWAAMEAAFGAGTVLGGVTALRLSPRRPLLFVNLCILLCAPGSIALGIPAPLAAIVAAQLIAGWSVGLYIPVWETLIQQRIPPAALSRVSAYDWMGSLVFMPLGFALAGPVAGVIGAPATLISGGVFCVIGVAATLAVPEIRQLERLPDTRPPTSKAR